eukprot:GHVU01164291.1.p2 GENE.GHVU01164291.1~~GHVU01164291.1.p2  ORF type:complete len:326 (-),score=53.19 GHVU01164291.1:173-1150(-)
MLVGRNVGGGGLRRESAEAAAEGPRSCLGTGLCGTGEGERIGGVEGAALGGGPPNLADEGPWPLEGYNGDDDCDGGGMRNPKLSANGQDEPRTTGPGSVATWRPLQLPATAAAAAASGGGGRDTGGDVIIMDVEGTEGDTDGMCADSNDTTAMEGAFGSAPSYDVDGGREGGEASELLLRLPLIALLAAAAAVVAVVVVVVVGVATVVVLAPVLVGAARESMASEDELAVLPIPYRSPRFPSRTAGVSTRRPAAREMELCVRRTSERCFSGESMKNAGMLEGVTGTAAFAFAFAATAVVAAVVVVVFVATPPAAVTAAADPPPPA